jgi:peptide/nickel transport system permease protein
MAAEFPSIVSLATVAGRPKSQSGRNWYRIPSLMFGLLLLGTMVAIAALAPVIAPYDPAVQDLNNLLQGSSAAHLLGTDHLGRDVLSRLLWAGRVDLQVGFLGIIAPFVVGTVLGSLAGYYGGWLNLAVTAAMDLVQAMPYYILIISLVFIVGTGTLGIYIANLLIAWVYYARILRGEVTAARTKEYVLAAQTAGLPDARILARHVLPNVIGQAIAYATSDITVLIVGIVTLSYLGLGVQPPTAEWGNMIFDGQGYITTHWQLATIPGLAVVVTGLGLSLVGDGLNDLLRPE